MGVALDTPVPKPQETPLRKVTYNADKDEVTVTTSSENFKEAQASMEFRSRAMVEMQKEADRIGAQEQQARSRNPIIGAIQEIGARLSQQPDMPGFVRGLGQASMAMNPNADELASRRLPLYMQLAKMEEENVSLAQRDRQIQQSGEIGKQNATSLAFSREQAGKSADERANTQKQQTLDRMARGERPLTIKQVLAVDPKMGLEEAQSWVEQSKANHEDRKLGLAAKNADLAGRREANAMLGVQRQTAAELNKAKAEHEREKAKLAPVVGAARVRVYDAHAANLLAREQIDRHEAAILTEKLRLDIEKFNSSEQFRTVGLLNEIEANVMMPEAEKEALRARVKNIAPERGAQSPATPSRVRVPEAPKDGKGPLQRGADFLFGGAREQATTAAGAVEGSLPPAIAAKLKPGVHSTLSDGSVWTLENGAPKRLR